MGSADAAKMQGVGDGWDAQGAHTGAVLLPGAPSAPSILVASPWGPKAAEPRGLRADRGLGAAPASLPASAGCCSLRVRA